MRADRADDGGREQVELNVARLLEDGNDDDDDALLDKQKYGVPERGKMPGDVDCAEFLFSADV